MGHSFVTKESEDVLMKILFGATFVGSITGSIFSAMSKKP